MEQQNRLDDELDAIVRKHSDMVLRLAYLRMRNRAEAEDVYQEVFLKLVENVHKLRSDDHIKYWLIRVTINACKQKHRKRTAVIETSYDEQLGDDAQAADKQPESAVSTRSSSVEDTVIAAEESALVLKAMRSLSAGYRIPLHLFYFERLSIREIAGILGVTEGAVKTRLSRAREKLAAVLKEYGYAGESR